jgi:methionyl-tRNA formyltransferase
MRLAFMGTPPFAAQALEALIAAGHEIAAVYSQPPRPAGRGHKLVPSAVHRLAEAHGIPVRTPIKLRTAQDEHEAFAALKLDLAVVAAYGLILPQPILDAPRLGCLNIHASLLPRWRGAAPIQRAILAGDSETGVTIMRMDVGLDTGPMLLKRAVPIGRWTTATALTDELADVGAELVVEAIARLEQGDLPDIIQPEDGVTYAAKLERSKSLIDWNLPAAELDRKVRALNPWPGAVFEFRGERVKLLEASIAAGDGPSGRILDSAADGSPIVACGAGALKLSLLQRPNRSAQNGASFLRVFTLGDGDTLNAGG